MVLDRCIFNCVWSLTLSPIFSSTPDFLSAVDLFQIEVPGRSFVVNTEGVLEEQPSSPSRAVPMHTSGTSVEIPAVFD